MAFSTRRGAGGWAQSLLPTAATKSPSKQPRKSRRRTTAAFRDFIIANFFTIGLGITFVFFIFILFRFAAVPRPLQLRPSAARARLSRLRKPVVHKSPNSTILAADVDITTKELYDKIQFLDEDGGPWKQGWRVSYKGHEWDEEKLKVFVVPHSHNDPGWKLTVEEYYDRQSRHILDTIVDTLSKVKIISQSNRIIVRFIQKIRLNNALGLELADTKLMDKMELIYFGFYSIEFICCLIFSMFVTDHWHSIFVCYFVAEL